MKSTVAGIGVEQRLLLIHTLPILYVLLSLPPGQQDHDDGQNQHADSHETADEHLPLRIVEHQRVLQFVVNGHQVVILLHQF